MSMRAGCLALRAGGDEVGDLAREAAGSSPHRCVADDRAAHAVVEVEVGEIAQGPRGRGVPFRPGRPVHVVVDRDRSLDVGAENLDRVKLAEQERGIGQVDQPPCVPVDRVSRAHDRQPRQRAALLLDAGDGSAQRDDDLVRAGGSADVLFRPGHGVAMGVKALGHDPVRCDAHGQGDSVVGQGVVRAHPAATAAAHRPLAGVGHQAGLGQPTDALPHGRLGDAGRGRQLGARQPPALHERAQHMLVGQRPQRAPARAWQGPSA